MKSDLADVARHVGAEELPPSWQSNWKAYMELGWPGLLKARLSDEHISLIDLPRGCVEPLQLAWAMVRQNEDLCELCGLWHYLIYHMPGNPEENIRSWPLPVHNMGELADLFPLVAFASGLDHTLDEHARRGIPEEVTRQTLADVGLWVRKFHGLEGRWGFGELIWLRRHARSEVLALGRLQFESTTLKWAVCGYGNSSTNELRGWWMEDPAPGEGWERILSQGDDMIGVHIPEGGKMLPEDCDESFARALEGFPKWFPEKQFKAFTCYSWLIDPALQELLTADSNIVLFQKRFHLLPFVGSSAQTYDRVFGKGDIDISQAPRETSLQRAIADYVLSGGQMRCCSGFIPIDTPA